MQIKRDPTVVEEARRYLRNRLAHASTREVHDLREWDTILRTMSHPRLLKFLTDPGERATRLRQSMPFLGVLHEADRRKLLAEMEA